MDDELTENCSYLIQHKNQQYVNECKISHDLTQSQSCTIYRKEQWTNYNPHMIQPHVPHKNISQHQEMLLFSDAKK